jgi:hypothetical protein
MEIERIKYYGLKFFLYGFLAELVGFLIAFIGGYIHQRFISVLGFCIGVGAGIMAALGFGLLYFSLFRRFFVYVCVLFGVKKFDVAYVQTKDTTKSIFKVGLTTILVLILIIAIIYFIFKHFLPNLNWEWSFPQKVS